MEHTNQNLKEISSPFANELKKQYLALIAKKAEIDAQLADLKSIALKSAPELITIRRSFKWDYKPGIHRLPASYFKLDTAKISAVYNSAAGGEQFLAKYGLSFKEASTLSWKPLKNEKEVN